MTKDKGFLIKKFPEYPGYRPHLGDTLISGHSLYSDTFLETSLFDILNRMKHRIGYRPEYTDEISCFTPGFNALTNKLTGLLTINIVGSQKIYNLPQREKLMQYPWVKAVFTKLMHYDRPVCDLTVICACDPKSYKEAHESVKNILRTDGFIPYGKPCPYTELLTWPDRFLQFKMKEQ